MTKGIEDMLNLPHLDDILKENEVDFKSAVVLPGQEEESTTPMIPAAPSDSEMLKSLERALQTLEGNDHGKAMDTIFQETLDHSRALMDLGYNLDDRSRRGIFEIATSMYKNAIDAKNSKRDAQLKLMKMLLDQRSQEFKERQWKAERGEDDPGEIKATATLVEDRNELIKRMRAEAGLNRPDEPKKDDE